MSGYFNFEPLGGNHQTNSSDSKKIWQIRLMADGLVRCFGHTFLESVKSVWRFLQPSAVFVTSSWNLTNPSDDSVSRQPFSSHFLGIWQICMMISSSVSCFCQILIAASNPLTGSIYPVSRFLRVTTYVIIFWFDPSSHNLSESVHLKHCPDDNFTAGLGS